MIGTRHSVNETVECDSGLGTGSAEKIIQCTRPQSLRTICDVSNRKSKVNSISLNEDPLQIVLRYFLRPQQSACEGFLFGVCDEDDSSNVSLTKSDCERDCVR